MMNGSRNRKVFIALVFAPLGWGVLSFLIFSVLQPRLPGLPRGFTPWWIWLWLLQMALVIPFWRWLEKLNLHSEQRLTVNIGQTALSLGSPVFYLWIAYIAAIPGIFTFNHWYGKWFVFGGLVSPVFEELLARNSLTPWLRKGWIPYLALAAVSSASFSLMHWGFNGGGSFSLPVEQQLWKFVNHFIFGFALCLLFRFTKNIPILIWLHVFSNLRFLLTKL